MVIARLNINSLRNKFASLSTMIKDNIDVLLISQSKIDSSFSTAQFHIDHSAFEIQVLSTSAISGFFSLPHQYISKKNKTAEDSTECFYITSAMASAYINIFPRSMICFLTAETTCST